MPKGSYFQYNKIQAFLFPMRNAIISTFRSRTNGVHSESCVESRIVNHLIGGMHMPKRVIMFFCIVTRYIGIIVLRTWRKPIEIGS